jgi:hypothetical protein
MQVPVSLALLSIGVLLTGGCADSSFSGSSGVRKPKVEQTQSSNSLPSGSSGGLPTPTPNPPGFEILEGATVNSAVGINFDDRAGNVDYNDTAYCFVFRGVIKGKQVVSAAKQTVRIRRSNRSACSHEFEITIRDASRNVKQTVTDQSTSNTNGNLQIDVDRGDFIDVTGKSYTCGSAFLQEDRLMSNDYFFRIGPNCNNSGR